MTLEVKKDSINLVPIWSIARVIRVFLSRPTKLIRVREEGGGR
jgi:hypothetical protein